MRGMTGSLVDFAGQVLGMVTMFSMSACCVRD